MAGFGRLTVVLDDIAPLTYSIAVHRTVVINAVGLTERRIGTNTPGLREFVARGTLSHIEPVIPAVTCSAQSTYLTGRWPDEHGIVGNGWYFRDESEIKFWRQSNRLVAG